MRLSKKFSAGILPLLFCLVALLMVACESGNNRPTVTKAPASQQVFVDPEEGVSDIATFDPGLSTDAPSIAAIDMVFTGLVELNDQLQVVPQEAAPTA
jgi:oligopeptide transport system substrate-binding protein